MRSIYLSTWPRWSLICVWGIIAFLIGNYSVWGNENQTSADTLEFFEKKIRPLFVAKCYNCHSANTNAKGELRVDDRLGLIHGGRRGPAVVPGQPEKSLLLEAVSYKNKKLKMPPEEQLSKEEIADLTRWIADGAAWPAAELPYALGEPDPEYERLKREHWAWQPLAKQAPPNVADKSWSRDAIDRFLLAELEAKKLRPTGDADKVALIRRVTFDLTGLPPTIAEVDEFLADESAVAFSKVVDRLLASPAFGERWGRHWLDVARFAESTGSSRNMPYPHAWRYRDYVIDSFNADKPYDQFVREQIAGDLLPAKDEKQREEQQIATGFLALGVKDVNQRFKVRFAMDNIDEQIDTVTRSMLGLTASCARCHDHKFDPIPATDYYALAGIFNSTDICAGVRNKMGGGGLEYYAPQMLIRLASEVSAPDPELVAKAEAKYEKAKAEWDAIRGTPRGLERAKNGKPRQRSFRVKMERAQAELMELTDPATRGAAAMGVREAKLVGDTELRIAGEAEQLGPVVPRGFLSVLALPNQPAISGDQSGRLQLAQWLSDESNPLASRVIVNRIWQHLFGRGLVSTVDNFGVMGDVPSHPELLDYLAAKFVDEGWSIKSLVRTLVLTRVYQLSSVEIAENMVEDPANRLLWRHSPRRLDAEEIRDAVLATAGTLDVSRPEASQAKELRVVELLDSSPIARRLEATARESVVRSIYLPQLRNLTPISLQVFDFAEQGMVTGHRDATTVATQALYLLNDSFIRRQSIEFAKYSLSRADLSLENRVNLIYRHALGREASSEEVSRALGFVEDYTSTARSLENAAEDEFLALAQSPEGQSGDESAESLADAAKDEPPRNPDEIPAVEAPVIEDHIGPIDPEVAAWANFCQALYGSVEFRYTK
jgi:cytochrome c553